MGPDSKRLSDYIGVKGNEGIEFWYPVRPLVSMRRVDDLVPLFVECAETFGREFWPSWN